MAHAKNQGSESHTPEEFAASRPSAAYGAMRRDELLRSAREHREANPAAPEQPTYAGIPVVVDPALPPDVVALVHTGTAAGLVPIGPEGYFGVAPSEPATSPVMEIGPGLAGALEQVGTAPLFTPTEASVAAYLMDLAMYSEPWKDVESDLGISPDEADAAYASLVPKLAVAEGVEGPDAIAPILTGHEAHDLVDAKDDRIATLNRLNARATATIANLTNDILALRDPATLLDRFLRTAPESTDPKVVRALADLNHAATRRLFTPENPPDPVDELRAELARADEQIRTLKDALPTAQSILTTHPTVALEIHRAILAGRVRFATAWQGSDARQTCHDTAGQVLAELFRTSPGMYGVRAMGTNGEDGPYSTVREWAERMMKARGIVFA